MNLLRGKADRRTPQGFQPSLFTKFYPWAFAYYASIQFSVPCRQNINLCQYWLSQITCFCFLNLPKLALPLSHCRKLNVYPLGPSFDWHPILLTLRPFIIPFLGEERVEVGISKQILYSTNNRATAVCYLGSVFDVKKKFLHRLFPSMKKFMHKTWRSERISCSRKLPIQPPPSPHPSIKESTQ